MSKEEFSEYYKDKKVTGTYDDQRLRTEYRRQKRQKELDIFLELLDKKGEEEVLELGCSSGFLTEHLGKVTAIDTSKDMLKIANEKNPQSVVLEADMFNLPFKDNSFDKVVTMRVWTHVRRFVHFFYKKIFRITGFKIYPYSITNVKKILSEEGFTINKIKFLKHKIGRQIVLKSKVTTE
jgi:ubiquinone/menaquinone biosynthesis C-methylase UbiE